MLLVTSVFCAGVPFSAEMVLTDSNNQQTVGKVFVAQEKIRQEMADAKTGQIGTTILRLDKGVVWILMPEQKMYMEMGLDKAKMTQYAAEKTPELIENKIDLGKETVNGYVCTKTQYVYKDKSLGTSIVWMADRLQYGIKFESKSNQGTSVTEYRKIKEGPQSDKMDGFCVYHSPPPCGYPLSGAWTLFENLHLRIPR